jgi:hypothetical protein
MPAADPPEAALRQMVLKLPEPPQRTNLLSSAVVERLIEPWQRFVRVVVELKTSSASGATAVPQTPETIAPYVFEEADDILRMLQTPLPDQSAVLSDTWQQYVVLETLAPRLLWHLASSSYEMLHLMEGITARVFHIDQGWQTGVLRLVALLEVQFAGASQPIDLATYQTPQFLVRPAVVQSDDCELCQQAIDAEQLLQTLTQQAQRSTTIRIWLDGIAAAGLAPGQTWQAGSVRLSLEWEFVAATEDAVVDWVLNTDSLLTPTHAVMLDLPAVTEPAAPLKPMLRFTDTDWLSRYTAAIDRQQWHQLLPELPALWVLQGRATAAEAVPLLVEQASEAIDLMHSWTESSDGDFAQAIEIDRLRHRWLWRLSSSSYEIMQFLGGVAVRLLQPHTPWQTGTLRLRVGLDIKTPEFDWNLDLAIGQPRAASFSVTDDAIVCSRQSEWCRQPNSIAELLSQVRQQLDQSALVQQLLQGTSVDVLMSDCQWHAGAMQLSLEFEFVRDVLLQGRSNERETI